ncbi:hypothetical protein ABEB36_009172 [Hypothenemus hampei]|uniref:deoxyribose-phosphate aldolase n=1 Tax=Hypothenemus hampei TaxID=57062 RepID=A0ABD1ESC4_HYPHA
MPEIIEMPWNGTNSGCELDLDYLKNVNMNLSTINYLAQKLILHPDLKAEIKIQWILKAISLIDLTTLAGDDTPSIISRLCSKAAEPISKDILQKLEKYGDYTPLTTAAVCVYPLRVEDAVKALTKLQFNDKIKVASVATGFPCGQTPLHARLEEIKYAVQKGAQEIDIVINRTLVLTGQWEALYEEIKQMKEASGKAHMKTILATGELGNLNNVYKASMIAMMAGSDFIKTSTGKENINATLQFGIVMSRAIKDYYIKEGVKVGLKPAGGVKSTRDALNWILLIKQILGEEWLTPELFRFGASGLLTDLEKDLYYMASNGNSSPVDL